MGKGFRSLGFRGLGVQDVGFLGGGKKKVYGSFFRFPIKFLPRAKLPYIMDTPARERKILKGNFSKRTRASRNLISSRDSLHFVQFSSGLSSRGL